MSEFNEIYEQDLSTNNLVNTSTSGIGDTSIIVDDIDVSGYVLLM